MSPLESTGSCPRLFEGTASYYSRYRPRYPKQAIDTLIHRFSLNQQTRVLDLGCGTGQIAIPLAALRIPVHAVDPEIEMLCEGIVAEKRESVSGICWQTGSDDTLDRLSLPPITVCAMGASLHWMNRERVLQKLDGLIVDNGGVAVLSENTSVWSGKDAVSAMVKQVVIEFLGPERRAGAGTFSDPAERHDILLRRSPFSNLEELLFEEEHILTVSDIIGLQLSTSYASPAQLGSRLRDFKDSLNRRLFELNPSGCFLGTKQWQMLIARR